MTYSICVRCGTTKGEPWRRCPQCGLDPRKDNDLLVKSVYLSVARFEDPDEHPAYRKELADIARRLKAGESPRFDEEELARLRTEKSMVDAVPLSAVMGALLRLFLPAIGILLILAALTALVRSLK